MNKIVIEDLYPMIREILEDEHLVINPDSKIFEELLLDSILYMELICRIEIKYDVHVNDSLLYLEADCTVSQFCKNLLDNIG